MLPKWRGGSIWKRRRGGNSGGMPLIAKSFLKWCMGAFGCLMRDLIYFSAYLRYTLFGVDLVILSGGGVTVRLMKIRAYTTMMELHDNLCGMKYISCI